MGQEDVNTKEAPEPTVRPVSAFSPTSAGSGPSTSPRNGSAAKSPLAGPYSPYSPIALSSPPSASKKREEEELLVLSGKASNDVAPAFEAVVTSVPDSEPAPAVMENVSSVGPERSPIDEVADDELLVLSGKPTVTIPDLAELAEPAQENPIEAREESPKQDEALFVLDGHTAAVPTSPTGSRSPLRGAAERPFAASDSATPSSPEQEMLVLSGMEVNLSQAAETEETPEASSAEPAELQFDDTDEQADLESSAEAVEAGDDVDEGSDLADAADNDDDTMQSAGMAAEGEPAVEASDLEEEEDANAVNVSPGDMAAEFDEAGEEQEEDLSYGDAPVEEGESGYASDNDGEEGPVAMQPLDTYFEAPDKSDELGEDEGEDEPLAAKLDMPLAAADAPEDAADEPIPATDESEEDAAEAADASVEGPVPMSLEATEADQRPEDDLESHSSSTVAEGHNFDEEAGEPEAQTAASEAPESVAAATEPSVQSAEEESSYSSPERKTSAGTSAVDELQFTTPREAPAATPDEVCLVFCLYELLRLRCYRCGSTLMKAKFRKPVAVRCEFSMCSPDS
jgi:hypothetical protein